MLPITKHWRNIVEMSNMSNNDEYVFYTEREVPGNAKDLRLFGFRTTAFDNPCLILSRHVYEIEIKAGLIITRRPLSTFDYKSPEASYLIDAIYRLADVKKNRWDRWDKLSKDSGKKTSISTHIAMYVGHSLYDCMSGGMPTFEISLIKYMLDNIPDINWDTYVYPRLKGDEGDPNKDYITLRDFYENHAQKAPDLTQSAN